MRQVVNRLVVAVALVVATMLPSVAAFAQSAVPGPPPVAPSEPAAGDAGEPEPPPPPMDDPSPQVAVVLTKLHELDAQQQLHGAQAALDAAQNVEALTRSKRDVVRDDREQKRALLASAVTAAYVRGDQGPSDDEITAD